MTIVSPHCYSFTSSLTPAYSMIGLGGRMPREFPMRTRRVFYARITMDLLNRSI